MKKFTSLLLALLLLFSLVGCTSDGGSSGNSSDGDTLVVGASPSPHAVILEFVKPMLAEQGITLEIREFTDYVLPNIALDEGDLDANFFQHEPYLINFNSEYGTDLIAAAKVHFELLGIYAGKSSDLNNIADGAVIAVPNDTTNEARALQLLESIGLIKIDPSAGLEATVNDITENPHNISIQEIEAAQLPRMLQDTDFAVINGNYALLARITDKMLETESPDADGAMQYVNVLAVRNGDENREDIKALVDALLSPETAAFIEETFGGVALSAVSHEQ